MNIDLAIWTLPQAMQVVEAVGRGNFGIFGVRVSD